MKLAIQFRKDHLSSTFFDLREKYPTIKESQFLKSFKRYCKPLVGTNELRDDASQSPISFDGDPSNDSSVELRNAYIQACANIGLEHKNDMSIEVSS